MQFYKVFIESEKAYEGQFQVVLLELCDGLINKSEDYFYDLVGDLLLIRP